MKPRAAARRRSFRITREGRVFVVVAVGVGVAAVNTGNNLLYLVLGLMLSLLLVSGVLSDFVLYGVHATRNVPSRWFVDRPAPVELSLANQKRYLPSLSIEVTDLAEVNVPEGGAGEPRPAYFLRVSAGQVEHRIQRRVPTRRGVLRLEAIRLCTRYPFGLIEKVRRIPLRAEVVVYPALVPVRPPDVPALLLGFERSARRAGRGPEVAGVRGYRQGDEARDIHSRKSAAAGSLVVRERELETRPSLVLLLDERRPAGPREPSFEARLERAISETASLCQAALARDVGVQVVTASGASPQARPGEPLDPLLRFLALLESAPADARPPEAPPSALVVTVGARATHDPAAA